MASTIQEPTGNSVPFACSICGRRRIYPDELNLCDDGLFRCTVGPGACDERTAYNVDQTRAAWRPPTEMVPAIGGPPFIGDTDPTFLEAAAEYRSLSIPGWTPSSTFYDDFAVVPGGVGSSWTSAFNGAGMVSQPSANVARLDTTASGDLIRINALGVAVPDPSVGNVFCAFRAKTSIVTSPTGSAMGGAAIGGNSVNAIGKSFANAFYTLLVGGVRTAREVDTVNYCVFRVWWKRGGGIFGSVDDSRIMSNRNFGSGTRSPYLIVQNGPTRMDLTNYVCWT